MMSSAGLRLSSSENLEVFTEDFIQIHGSQSTHIYSVLTDQNYTFVASPSHTSVYDLPGLPADMLIYGERDATTGVISLKTDAATIKKLIEDIDVHKAKVHHNRMIEGVVLNDLNSKLTELSKSLIRYAAGDAYEKDKFNLSKVWWYLIHSHAKGNTTAMLEAVVNMSNLSMGNKDFHVYASEAAAAFKMFNKVYADYWDKPMKHFADVYLALSVIGGLTKGNEVFANVVQGVRLRDLSTASDTPIYPAILDQLVKADKSKSLLVAKPQYMGMSAQANSSMNLTMVCKCSACKETSIPYEVDKDGAQVKDMCKDCFKRRKVQRKVDWEARQKAKTKAAPTSEKVIHANKLKVIASTTPVQTPKPAKPQKTASAANFSGTTNIANASESKHYLQSRGEHPESEYDEDGASAEESD